MAGINASRTTLLKQERRQLRDDRATSRDAISLQIPDPTQTPPASSDVTTQKRPTRPRTNTDLSSTPQSSLDAMGLPREGGQNRLRSHSAAALTNATSPISKENEPAYHSSVDLTNSERAPRELSLTEESGGKGLDSSASRQLSTTTRRDAGRARLSLGGSIYAKALLEYKAKRTEELSFTKDDVIRVIQRTDDPSDWWEGEFQGIKGQVRVKTCRLRERRPFVSDV
jgi:hypothetical protein